MKLSKKYKSIFGISLAALIITFFSLNSSFASTTDPEITTETESNETEQVSSLQNKPEEYNPKNSKEATIESVEDIEDELMIEPLKVSTSKTLNLGVGKSWSKSFTMNNPGGSDHNTFNTKVSNVTSGKYKVIITGSNGYKYESPERSGTRTYTTSNAKSGVTYKVTIVNTSASNLKAKADITSYIK